MPRTAIVTGGTKGIGLAACKELTRLGYRVAALWAHDKSAAEAAARGSTSCRSGATWAISTPAARP